MKIFEIENHNALYTFNLNRIDYIVLGDGSTPVEKAKTILVWYEGRYAMLTFESSKEARKNYDMIKELMHTTAKNLTNIDAVKQFVSTGIVKDNDK